MYCFVIFVKRFCIQTLKKFFVFQEAQICFTQINTNLILPNYTRKYYFVFACCYTLKRDNHHQEKQIFHQKNLSCPALRRVMTFYLMNSQIFTEIKGQQIFQYHLATVLLFHQVTYKPPQSIWYIKHHLGTLTKKSQMYDIWNFTKNQKQITLYRLSSSKHFKNIKL